VNHRKDDWAKTLIAEIGPVLTSSSTCGGDTFNKALDVVKPGGRVVSYGSTLGPAERVGDPPNLLEAIERARKHDGARRRISRYAQAVRTHGLRPIIDKVFPLEQASDAHIRMEAGDQFGKIVLRM
jgi:NADPH:quinone reductase-like Zn-dependent oxidoreductase